MDAFYEAIDWAWLAVPVAFVGMLALTPLVIRLAHRRDWLAYPQADRWHATPTALMGGIAIFGAVLLTAVLWFEHVHWTLWAGASVMFATGLVDDLRDLQPATKLTAQIVATCCLVYGGFVLGTHWPLWLSLPLTFVWVMGVTNAVNLLDNMDGLAAGVAAIAAAALAAFAALEGHLEHLGLLLAAIGAAAGFLVFNFKPARIFMGDSGSLFLGYVIAAYALVVQAEGQTTYGMAVYLVPLASLAVPIFDTTLVTMTRIRSGRAISQGGRDHSSHRLVFQGLNERQAVLALYGISALFGALAVALHFADVRLLAAVLVLAAVGLVFFGAHLAGVDVYAAEQEDDYRRAPRLLQRVVGLPNRLLGQKWKNLAGVLMDVLLVGASFVVAHYLRYETGLTAERTTFLLAALPLVVAVKIVVFSLGGLHRAIWRHAGTPEVVRIVLVSALASVLAFVAVGAAFGFGPPSPAVALIDFMLVTLAVLTTRLSFRGLRQFISSQRRRGEPVVIYGTDDTALSALRQLRQDAGHAFLPVGFVDDHPAFHGRTLQGLPVLGGAAQIERLHQRREIAGLVIACDRAEEAKCKHLATLCEQLGLTCWRFRVSVDVVQPGLSGDGAPERATPHFARTGRG